MTQLAYIVVSPVKDEEKFIQQTLESMACQSRKPVAWIIVDDGSKDATVEKIRKWQEKYSFIHLLTKDSSAAVEPRQPGAGVIRAFNRGLTEAQRFSWDVIVKLDCDLKFSGEYFNTLMERFEANPKLGIASGIYSEERDGRWIPVKMPPYHAAGACKVVRKECFAQIAGFVAAKGWDTVDEIRAISRGWITRHFTDLQMQHLKPEGSGIGQIRTHIMLGEIYRQTGGSKLFFAVKLVRRLVDRPVIVGSLAMLAGYAGAALRRKPLLVSREEARQYSRILIRRLLPFAKETSSQTIST
jgi:poly-beta-1,6-N-acetyl-D-glucosamine synthase